MIGRLLGLLAALLLLPVAVLVLVLAALQSPTIRAQAEAAVNRFVPGVTIRGLGAGLPSRLALDELRLEDGDGVWLEGHDLRIVWRPAALLDGLAHVDEVAATELRMRRPPMPAAEAEAEPAPEPDGSETDAATLPTSVLPLRIDRLGVDAIVLDAPVVGTAATFALDGAIDGRNGEQIALDLALTRSDRPDLAADLAATIDLPAGSLDLRLALNEASGLLTALAGEPRLEPFAFTLTGAGPLADWSGRIDLIAGTLASFETDLALALPAPLAAQIDGTLRAGPDISGSPLGPLLAEPIDIAVSFSQADGVTALDRLAIRAAWLDIAGTASLGDGNVAAELAAVVDDLAVLAPLTGQTLAGDVRLQANVAGPLPLPPGTVTIDATGVEASTLTIAELRQRIEVRDAGDGAIGFALDGGIDGLAMAVADQRLEEDLSLEGSGSLTPGGPFALERLALTGRLLALNAMAEGDLGAGTVDANATLDVPQLAALRALSPAIPSGGARVAATARLRDGFQAGDLTLNATTDELAELPAPAGALLGAAPRFDLEATLAPLPQVLIERLTLEGAHLQLAATAAADIDAQQGSLDGTLALPDLAIAGDALGQALEGALTLAIEADGGRDGFAAEAALVLDDLVAGGQTFDAARADLSATGTPDAIEGTLTSHIERAGAALDLDTAYGVTPALVSLDRFSLTGPGTELAGDLRLDVGGPSATGSFTGGAPDLGALGDWLGLPLAGRVALDLVLDDSAGQAATLNADAAGVDAFGLRVASASIEASGTDLLDALALDAAVRATGVEQGTTRVETAALDVAGNLERLTVNIEAEGGLPDPFDVAGEALVQRQGEVTETTLERLDGNIADIPIRLLRPATVRLDAGTIELDGLELEIDAARLSTRASLAPERVDAALSLEPFELARLADLGGPAIAGTLASEWSLSGTPGAPIVEGQVLLAELQPPDSAGPPVSLTADVTIDGDGLAARLASEGLGEPALGAAANLPLRFALEPFVFSLPNPLPLDAQLAGVIDLARAAAWYGLDGIDVDGQITADVTAAGTVASPLLDGRIETTNARFVDAVTGILIENVNLELRATQERLEVARLQATDGREGSLDGRGSIAFGEAGLDVDVSTTLDRFAVVQSEDLFVVISGDTEISGGTPVLDVFSRLTVNRGDIFLASPSGAANFASLDVVTMEELTEPDEAATSTAAPAGVVQLDIAVALPSQLFVRGRGLVSEWTGNVDVTGDASAPSVTGLIEYRRGYIELLRNRFDFRKGDVRLTGEFPPDPFLDIEATVPAGDYLAVLALSGAALDPDISITSEPVLPEDEVLSQLLFGQDSGSLNTFQALQLASALKELQGGRGLGDRLRTGFGLDTLQVGGESFDTATVRGGVYVSEDVFLELQQGLEPGSGAARVEVELTPRTKLELRANEDQTSSVGVRWRLDY